MKRKKVIALIVSLLCLQVGIQAKEVEQTKDPNESYKYTKEELKEKYSVQRQGNKQDTQEENLQYNATIKKEYLAKKDIYLLPNSATEKLDASQIRGFNGELLALARNEIFARHGYIFTKASYKTCFKNKKWYKPSKQSNQIKLSAIEQYNVKYLEWQEKYIKQGKDYYTDNRLVSRDTEVDFCDMYRFEAGQSFKMDLNNDGIQEEIKFEMTDLDGGDRYSGVIKINGQPQMLLETFLQSYVWVIDIDTTDQYKELVINDMGASFDYVDHYFYYDGKRLEFMGKVTGNINNKSNYIRNYGKEGILHATQRCDILGTAWYNCDYKLNKDHKLEQIPCDYYKVAWQTYAKKPITLYKTQELSSQKVKYQAGLPMMIVGTDLKEWVEVKLEDGTKGWFNTEQYNTYHLDGIRNFD